MDALARIGLLITCVVAIYVGARTLYIWRSTQMVQEFCIGLNLISIAMGGLILTILGSLNATSPASYPLIPYALGLFGLVVHVGALFVGTWKIFRPSERWPLPLSVVAITGAVVWMVWTLTATGGSPVVRSSLLLVIRGVGMTWAAYECFRYSAMLRKRAALGLGDPMIAHRIWLWGLGASASGMTIGLEAATWAFRGAQLGATPAGLHAMSLLGLCGTLAIAFAFFPPAAYVRLMERRQAPQAA